MSRGLEPWLVAHLVQTGAMTEDGVTARPRWRECSRCRAWTIAAIEDEPRAMPRSRVAVHPMPVTPLGELQAITLGLSTFTIDRGGIAYRYPHRIGGASADDVIVCHAHRCGGAPVDYVPVKGSSRRSPGLLARSGTETPSDGCPPF